MTLSMLGLGALLAASATLFTALKWIGAAYLVYLGIRLWRAPVAAAAAGGGRSPLAMLGHAFLVTALNPKSVAFFVAFLPQFMRPAELKWLNRAGGAILIGAGLATAAAKRG